MSTVLSRRDRRTLVVGAAVIVALVAASKALPAWRGWDAESRAAAAEIVAEVLRAERDIAAVGALRDTLASRNARYIALAERIVPGDGASSAASELATLVSASATEADLSVGTVRILTDTSGSSPFVRVSVRGDLVGDLDGLTLFLADVERGPLLLAVRELTITQPEPAAPDNRPEILRVQFLIEGIALRRAAARRAEEGE